MQGCRVSCRVSSRRLVLGGHLPLNNLPELCSAESCSCVQSVGPPPLVTDLFHEDLVSQASVCDELWTAPIPHFCPYICECVCVCMCVHM